MTEAVMVALIASGSASFVAAINQIPLMKQSKKLNELLETVNGLKVFVEEEETIENVRARLRQVQAYFVSRVKKDKDKLFAVSKSEAFIALVCDYAMTLNFDDMNSFTQFKEHLLSASHGSRERMISQVGKRRTEIYYKGAYPKMLRYADIVQKIFFANENAKRSRVIAASIDFMQSFMTDFVCILNHKKSEGEAIKCLQRCGDHRSVDETIKTEGVRNQRRKK